MDKWVDALMHGIKREKRIKCTEREAKRVNYVAPKKIKDSLHIAPLKSLSFRTVCAPTHKSHTHTHES